MRIHTDDQTAMYDRYWLPMERTLSDKELTEFIRHYLKRDGAVVRESEVYFKLREDVNDKNAVEKLAALSKFANFYYKLLHPANEVQVVIWLYLQRLNVLEVTTVYPFC